MSLTSDIQSAEMRPIRTGPTYRLSGAEAMQYRVFYAVCFLICLPLVLVSWLMPGMSRRAGSDTSTTGRSIIGEARASAAVAAGYAFTR